MSSANFFSLVIRKFFHVAVSFDAQVKSLMFPFTSKSFLVLDQLQT